MTQYNKDFKINAVSLCRGNKSVAEVARDLGLPKSTLKSWVKNYKVLGDVAFPGSGNINPDNQELHALKKELDDIRLERDILKKAVAIFSKQNY